MTAQIHDQVIIGDKRYSICGIDGGPLFAPQDVGLQPQALSTACWRGFYCTYTVLDHQLLLSELGIGLDPQHPIPVINGRTYSHQDRHTSAYVYTNLNRPQNFTGSLVLGSELLQSLYVHMGFHPPYKWKNVLEITCDHGRVTNSKDRSEEMATTREQRKNQSIKPDADASEEEVIAWLSQVFSLSPTEK